MTIITREVLDLHLRRTDDRFESQLAACRLFLTEQRESSQRLFDERFERFRAQSIQEREDLKEFSREQRARHAEEYGLFRQEIRAEISDFKKESKSLRITVILTGIGTATSIIFGVATFNSTLISSHASSFDVGKQLAETASKISADLHEARERDRRFNEQQSRLKLQRDASDMTTAGRAD